MDSAKKDIKEIISAIMKVGKNIHNAQRRSVRRALAAAYDVSWQTTRKLYPTIKKNSGVDPSFADRVTRRASLLPETMNFTIFASTRRFSLIEAVLGERKPENQKGLKISERKPSLRFKLGKPFRSSTKPFIFFHKKHRRNYVATKPKGNYRLQMRASIKNILTEKETKKRMIEAVLNATEKEFEGIF